MSSSSKPKADVAVAQYEDAVEDVELQKQNNKKSKKQADFDYDPDPVQPSSNAHVSGCFCGDGCAHSIARYMYAALFVLSSVLAVILKWTNPGTFMNMSSFKDCETNICRGNQAVYRISFSLAIFFLVMTIGTLIYRRFHFNLWSLKILLLGGLTTGSFFIPNSFFDVYREVSRVTSIIYLVIEVFLLINMAYSIHEKLIGHMNTNENEDPHAAALGPQAEAEGKGGFIQKFAKPIYLILCFVLISAGIVGAALLFHFYGKCPMHNAMIGCCLAVVSLLTLLSVTNCIGKGLLTPAVLFVYTMFNLFSSLDSNPNGECNPFATRNNPLWMLIISITFTILALGRSASSAADDASAFILSGHRPAEVQDGGDVEMSTFSSKSEQEKKAMEHRKVNFIFIYHIIMTFASCYLAMMLTGWGSEHTDVQLNAPDRSEQSFWFKFGSICLTYVVYLWTLMAPLICRGRSFD